MAWARQAEQQGSLDVQAAGIASLIAIDASDFAAAQRWSVGSLSEGSPAEHPVESLVTQASIALAARDAVRAVQFADAALQRQPGDGRAWSTRGFAALLANDLSAAHTAFVKAVSAMAQHIGTWHGLGWTQILQGDLDGARSSFDTALALDRNFAESHGGLAVVLAMQSQRQAAQEHAELALRLDKANLSGRYAQALLSGEVKDAKDVQRFARRLLGGRVGPLGEDMGDIFKSPDANAAPGAGADSSNDKS
jgi:tetratricopeptide (TPR) repeat protein